MRRAIAVFLVTVSTVVAEEEPPHAAVLEKWLALSAAVQNAHAEFAHVPESAAIAADAVKPQLLAIDKALGDLVEAGALVRKEYKLAPLDDLPGDALDSLKEFAERFGEKHGYFVALELVGVRAAWRVTTFRPGKPVELVAHLPPGDVADFEKMLAEEKLLPKGG